MSDQEKELFIRALAAVAWADGKLAPEEIESLKDSLEKLGYHNREKADEILRTCRRLDFLDEIKALEEGKRIDLIKYAYCMADAHGGVSSQELELIRQLAESVFPATKWPMVQDWVISYAMFIKKSKALFNN